MPNTIGSFTAVLVGGPKDGQQVTVELTLTNTANLADSVAQVRGYAPALDAGHWWSRDDLGRYRFIWQGKHHA